MVKLATGKPNVELSDIFGEPNNGIISIIYFCSINELDDMSKGHVHNGAVSLISGLAVSHPLQSIEKEIEYSIMD